MNTKIILSSVLLNIVLHNATLSQIKVPADDTLAINYIDAYFSADGTLDFNHKKSLPAYFAPKGSNLSTIFCGSLWVGGIDAGGQLHVAAQTYHQNGSDFWPGPIMDSANYSPHEDTLWNKLWVVNKSTIDSFRKGLFGTKIPASILNWPGDGNTALGEMAHLAPYMDSNKNGYYDPTGGDYPLIRGDQAMYVIFNDDRGAKHGESGGKKFKIEVHLMVYQFNNPSDSVVYETTFMHYDIYNRSKNNYNNVYYGYWCDMDIGNGGDDYIGCDSANNYWYCYNGEPTDPDGSGQFAGEWGYHDTPPAQAVVYMCDPMNHFQFYNNDFTVQGNPSSDTMYYNYMQSIWGDKTHTTYGGTGYMSSDTNTNYMFPSFPDSTIGWSMVSAKYAPQDVRGLSSTGPLTLNAGDAKSLDIALVFAQSFSGNNISSVALLQKYVPHIKTFYTSQSFVCDSDLLGVNEINMETLKNTAIIYPNPFSSKATLQVNTSTPIKKANLKVYDMLGREVMVIDNIHTNSIIINRNNLNKGMYFYKLIEEGNTLVNGKFIVE
ncbi:MAG TPA: T9SS type A sorting domain-containing protein [Bacteroidia bacterium]|nr:T9SS type A sorting domain-containing protein [Bacteroidia bacterium]